MFTLRTAFLMVFFGLYLLVFGFLSFFYLGDSGMTGLPMGLGFGLAAFAIAWGMTRQRPWAIGAGLVHSLGLTVTFGWQASINFNDLMSAIGSSSASSTQTTAFLLISGLFIMALITTTIQVMLLRANLQENR